MSHSDTKCNNTTHIVIASDCKFWIFLCL